MINLFETPIEIVIDNAPVSVVGVDTGSYVASDGRTWEIPAGEEIGENSSVIQSQVEYSIENPPVEVLSEAQIWERKLNGFLSIEDLHLKASLDARNAFVGQYLLLSAAKESGQIQGNNTRLIWDYYNIPHERTVDELLSILLSYGFAWNQLFEEFAP